MGSSTMSERLIPLGPEQVALLRAQNERVQQETRILGLLTQFALAGATHTQILRIEAEGLVIEVPDAP